MAAVSDDLGRVAWKRGIEGQTLVFTNAFIGRDTLYLFQSEKTKVYVENGVKISFHTFPEERKLFFEMDRRYSKRCRQTFPSDNAHKSLLETFQAIGLSPFTYGA